jgi:hypothetical protein
MKLLVMQYSPAFHHFVPLHLVSALRQMRQSFTTVMFKHIGVQLTLRMPVHDGDTTSRVVMVGVALYLAASVVQIGFMVFDV